MNRRPRVKLITIPWELEVPTLSLASLAAVTPAQFDVSIVDLLRERLVLDEPVDLVGISASTPRIKAAYALADIYQRRGARVVIGGHHATAMPNEALQHADAVVRGEGETSWRRICEDFLGHPSRVSGIYHDAPPDLAALPQPRIDLMKVQRYSAFTYPIIASRGCPESCSFCFAKRMTRGYRTYPIAHVLEQIKRRPAWVRSLYFVDDNLPADPEYTAELFRALSRDKVPFGMQARIEFARIPKSVALAREAGCALISSGYESVNQESLDANGKRALASDYHSAITHIFNEGIMPSGNWMFGFDDDGPDSFKATLEFLDASDLLHSSFTTEIPFPGTNTYRRYEREGRILTRDYDEYVGKDHVVAKPLKMTPEQLQDGVRWVTLQFYSVARATRRARKGFKNERLLDWAFPGVRHAAMLYLNYYQVWQWHYRMMPSVQWLYRRLLDANKYRHVSDYFRRSNFWGTEHAPAPAVEKPEFEPRSPFFLEAGFKSSPKSPLKPVLHQCECDADASQEIADVG